MENPTRPEPIIPIFMSSPSLTSVKRLDASRFGVKRLPLFFTSPVITHYHLMQFHAMNTAQRKM